jgi:hypothetical protein
MDFEVLEEDPADHPLLALESYFKNRRRQLQDWEAEPPHRLGVMVLVVALFEIVLGWRLLSGVGLSKSLAVHSMMGASMVVLIELGLARVASEVAGFFNKKGEVSTAVTFFNLGLLPLFLILPLLLAAYSFPSLKPFALVGCLLLAAKVLANWRESLEVSFELSKFQSALVIYLASAIFTLFIFLGAYIGFISTVSRALN